MGYLNNSLSLFLEINAAISKLFKWTLGSGYSILHPQIGLSYVRLCFIDWKEKCFFTITIIVCQELYSNHESWMVISLKPFITFASSAARLSSSSFCLRILSFSTLASFMDVKNVTMVAKKSSGLPLLVSTTPKHFWQTSNWKHNRIMYNRTGKKTSHWQSWS